MKSSTKDLRAEEADLALKCLKRVIALTLENCILLRRSPDGYIEPPPHYAPFTELLVDMYVRNRDAVSILTFNYDLGLDCVPHLR